MKKIDVMECKLKILDDKELKLEINFIDVRKFAKSPDGLGWKGTSEFYSLGVDYGVLTIRKKLYPITE